MFKAYIKVSYSEDIYDIIDGGIHIKEDTAKNCLSSIVIPQEMLQYNPLIEHKIIEFELSE